MTGNDFPCCAPEKGTTMTDESSSPHVDGGAVVDPLQSGGGRVARYAEAIHKALCGVECDSTGDDEDRALACAVLSVADHELAARDAEIERLRSEVGRRVPKATYVQMCDEADLEMRRAEAAEAERDGLRAEVERTREASRLNAIQASRADRRADALEAKVARVEALDRGHSKPCTHPDAACVCSVPLFELRAALTEGTQASPTSRTTEGGCSDAPAEQRAGAITTAARPWSASTPAPTAAWSAASRAGHSTPLRVMVVADPDEALIEAIAEAIRRADGWLTGSESASMARAAYAAMVEHLGLVEETARLYAGGSYRPQRRLVSRWVEVDHGSE